MKHPLIRAALTAAVLSALPAVASADMRVEEHLKAMEARMNALEAEYQKQSNDDGKNQNGFNLGVGYPF